MYKINWDLFTFEQKTIIQQIIKEGNYKLITRAIILDNPQQELELQKFLESVLGTSSKAESKVREEMKKIKIRNEDPIPTPEEEAKWQALIDAENRGENPFATEEVKKEVDDENKKVGEEVKKLTKKELQEKLTELGVEFKATDKVLELQDLLNAQAHVITEEDLETNPELKEEGLKVGETIYLPVEIK